MASSRSRGGRVLAIAMLLFSSTTGAQTVISTTGGGAPVGPWGKTAVQTFGQTFTSPTDNVLQNFTFFVGPAPSLIYRAYVFAWDQALLRATGPALFTSAPTVGPGPFGQTFIPVVVNTGGLVLSPFTSYVAFLSTSGQGTIGEIALESSWESPAANQYGGGAFVWLNNGENTAAFTTQTWSTDRQGPGSDVRFTLQFASVPEPSSLALAAIGGGLLAATAFFRRRRRS